MSLIILIITLALTVLSTFLAAKAAKRKDENEANYRNKMGELANLQLKTISFLTGGASLAKLSYAGMNTQGEMMFSLSVIGDDPLSNISIKIIDLDLYRSYDSPNLVRHNWTAITKMHFLTVVPGGAYNMFSLPFRWGENINERQFYGVAAIAQDMFTTHLIIRKNSDDYFFAGYTKSVKRTELTATNIEDGFRRTPDEEVNFLSNFNVNRP